jgi:hypothetical protein
LIPIVDAESALTVEYQAGLVTIRHRDGTRLEKRIDAQKSGVIEKAIASAPTEKWKGFWQTLSIDGDIVLGEIVRDGETFRFQGLNGCPPGFAAILSALNEAGERRLFTANWKLQEEESEFHEKSPFAFTKSFDADHKPADETTGEQGVAPQSATRSELDSEGVDKPQTESEPRPR